MKEDDLRKFIRAVITEGIFDGKLGTGKAVPSDSKEKSKLRSEQQKSLNLVLKSAGTRIRAAFSPIEDEVDETPEDELFEGLSNFSPKKLDKDMAAKAAYSLFKVSIRRQVTPSELTTIIKKNGTLRSALLTVPGMIELQNAVNTKLEIMGKDPEKSVNESWAVLNEFIKQLSLVK